MPSDSTPLLHDLSIALLKVVGIVIGLAIIYPLVAAGIADSLK